MEPKFKLILKMIKDDMNYLINKSIPIEEYFFVNKDILNMIDLFILEPKKCLESFKDKILFVYYVKFLTQNELKESVTLCGVIDREDSRNFLTVRNFLATQHPENCSGYLEYFSSVEEKFLKIEIK